MNIFETPEQTSRRRHTSELKKIEEGRALQDKISDLRDSIRNKTPRDKIKYLEFYIMNEPFMSDLLYHLKRRNLFPSLTESDISSKMKEQGIFEFYKDIPGRARWGWGFNFDETFMDEAVKLYDLAVFELSQSADATATPAQGKGKKSAVSLAVKMNWVPSTKDLKEIIIKLKGNFLNYNSLDDIINGTESLSLTGSNKYVDALAFFYVLAEAEKIKIQNHCFKQIADTFGLDKDTLGNKNRDAGGPIISGGINDDELYTGIFDDKETPLHNDFLNRVTEIKKILKI